MHLRSITLKGFKSFPDRTRLEFAPGVSVIVGPNGSGKSNVTDAVLWAMGEQSPLAVRGQSMQDVIFGGGRGVQARSAAEVEIVLDNADGVVDLPVGEVSIVRRLDRAGEGEYRLNGARCRLVDVLEVLSDTGLGKEMHSVVSQGRVEAIVTSKPRDRRLLIEEAAGLGKHRKRRRRAQLKLDRTQDNLDRALDVEREARTRLRPLKRQAEAAELHERLERQTAEARWELARDDVRVRRAELSGAQDAATAARAARDEAQEALGAVAARREQAERALAERTERREALARRAFAARSAVERIELRLERSRETAASLVARAEHRGAQLRALRAQAAAEGPDEAGRERIEALEAELGRLDAERAQERERELAALSGEREQAAARVRERAAAVKLRGAELREADEACEVARRARRAAETSAEAARREAARVGGELASVNAFLRSQAGAPGGVRSLAGELEVEPGCELALAAALGGRLRAAIVDDLPAARGLLDRAGREGGRTLVGAPDTASPEAPDASSATGSGADDRATDAAGADDAGADAAGADDRGVDAAGADHAGAAERPPAPGARRLIGLVRGPAAPLALARRLLNDVWLVQDIDALAPGFDGVAVTKGGRAWFAAGRELRQAAEGGGERVLAERNRRDALVRESEGAVRDERIALAAVEQAGSAVFAADGTRDGAERALRAVERERSAAEEDERRAAWLIDERRRAPDQGASAVRRAQLDGELVAERRVAERAARDRAERAARISQLDAALARDVALRPLAERLAQALAGALEDVRARVEALEAELAADRQAGEGVALELRACASEEAQIHGRLRECGEAVTATEVRAQQTRDHEADATRELRALADRLGLEADPATEPLDPQAADGLRGRIERLVRRREQLGPVNPLAKAEYEEALAHVEELERQRTDLETALRELRALIRDTDRQIRETFEATFTAAARNFEELSERLFPGGAGGCGSCARTAARGRCSAAPRSTATAAPRAWAPTARPGTARPATTPSARLTSTRPVSIRPTRWEWRSRSRRPARP